MNAESFLRTAAIGFMAMLAAMCLPSCTQKETYLDTELGYNELHKNLRKETRELERIREKEQFFEKVLPRVEGVIEPVTPQYNPLDETTITISVQQESIHNVLFVIARNAGLNLIIEPGISLDNEVTISFENTRSSLVVENLLKAFDLAWEVKDNVFFVRRWDEQIFDLDFVNTITEVNVNSGGDIFGSSLNEGGGGGSLVGEFSVRTEIGGDFEEDSLYGIVLRSVESIISESDQLLESGGGQEADPETDGYFALDPVGGRLFVRTTPGKLEAVAKMLNNLRAKLTRQIQLDARILEVTLEKQFQLGVDWAYVSERIKGDNSVITSLVNENVQTSPDLNPNALYALQVTRGADQLTVILEALQEFGGIKTISNPHVRAKHGRPAMFTSGTSQSFVSEISREEDNESEDVIFTVVTSSVFDGVMLGVVPFIGDDERIDLQIYPIKSDVLPGSLDLVEITAEGDRISLPVVDVKNVSTTVSAYDGDTIILGGLIDKQTTMADNGVPGFADVPGLGWMFKSRQTQETVTETVIIMNIKII